MTLVMTATRKCSTCRKVFPETEEYFHRRTGGGWRGACRACYNGCRSGKHIDALSKGIRETQDKVDAAFHRIDPGGAGSDELRKRLSLIARRFRKIPLASRVSALAFFTNEVLAPEIGAKG